jgi:Uma2 family endonuclease
MQLLVEELERPVAIQWERGMTDDEYFEFCAENRDLRIERSAEGDILIMPPVGGESSFRNSELSAELRIWARKDGRGRAFDSSVEYFLPGGAAYFTRRVLGSSLPPR